METIIVGLLESELHAPFQFVHAGITMASNLSPESHLCVTIII